MKKYACLFFLSFAASLAYSQSYYVTYLKGDIFFNHKLLKLSDPLEPGSEVSSNDPHAELGLFNIKKGDLRLTFGRVKPQSAGGKHSELYQFIIQTYLSSYTTEDVLTRRGVEIPADYDLLKFFNYTDTLHGGNRILLIIGQQLPVASATLNTRPGDNFYICKTGDKTPICNIMPRKGADLTIGPAVFKDFFAHQERVNTPVNCIIKLAYTDTQGPTEESFPDPVIVSFLSPDDLKAIVNVYKLSLADRYGNDKGKLTDDLTAHLENCYGKFYAPAAGKLIEDDLK